jgi:tetratricopeptide (TPR) repeat protein
MGAILWTASSFVWAAAPTDGEAAFNVGLLHLRAGRAQQALTQFEQAIKQNPKNPYFYKGLGQAYLSLQRYKDAITAFRKALERHPEYADVHNDLGTALILAGQRGEGKKEYQVAYNDPINPTPELSARNLGQAYFEEKNFGEALMWYRTSLQRNPRYPDAYLGVADTYLAMNKPDLEPTKDDFMILLALGQAYYHVGRFTDARTRFEMVVKRDPLGPSGRHAAELLKMLPR